MQNILRLCYVKINSKRASIPQITTESAKSSALNLQSNDHNETKTMMERRREAVRVFDKTDKVGRSPPLRNLRWGSGS